MDKPVKYRELLKLVSKFGVYEDKQRAKGSERLWVKVNPDGTKLSIPVTCHGENYEIGVGLIRTIRRRFKLTEKDGVSDKTFYSKKARK